MKKNNKDIKKIKKGSGGWSPSEKGQLLTAILDPKEEYPSWLNDPKARENLFDMLDSPMCGGNDKEFLEKLEREEKAEIRSARFFHLFFWANFLICGIIIMKPNINTNKHNIKTVSTKTIRISGNKNIKHGSKEQIELQVAAARKKNGELLYNEIREKIKKELSKNGEKKPVQEKHKETSYPIFI